MSKQRIIYLISTLSILLLFSSFMPAGFPPSVIPDTRGQGLPANIKDKGLPALPEKALANNLPEDVSSEAASPQEVLPPSAAEAKKAPETRETVASRQGSRQKIKPESMAEAAVESKKNAGKLAGKVVVIDPGHGGYDPGAVGLSRGLEEKFVNLDTALRLKDLLGKAGAKVVLTRERDAFISLNQRVNIAHNNDAALFISIHANAHVDRTAGGTETYYNSNHLPRESLRLAELIQRELAGALNLRDMGVKNGDFYVIRATRIPSALVELAFLSNENEEGLLNRPSFRQGAAEAICRGVHRFFD